MDRFKKTAGALIVALTTAPIAPAFAHDGRHFHGGGLFPVFGLAAAVVGTAAAIATLPFRIIDSAVRAPGYYAPPSYAPAAGYAPPPVAQSYYSPATTAAPPGYYPPPAVNYYAPPVAYYYPPPAPYYAPPPGYYGGYARYR